MDNVVKLRKEVVKLRSKWRKLWTGSAEKRIRDHIREKQEEPKYVKLLDKIGFTMGVLNILLCQYFLLNVPEYFSVWYGVIVPILMISRFYHFRSLHWQYFMFDFCYFTLSCTVINTFVLHNYSMLFKICFIHSCGTLPIAIPVWRNSFIFHDYDKIVSVYIHILPMMLYYTLRWSDKFSHYCPDATHCDTLRLRDYMLAMLFYATWQVLYLLKTEVYDKAKFDADPSLLTSLRWMSKDTTNSTARMVLKIARKLGIFAPQEDYDSTTMKTKLVFVSAQMVLTMLWSLPSYFLYRYAAVHLAYIIFIFVLAIFNGASFYIEVFSIRYQLQLTKLNKMQQFAQETNKLIQKVAELETSQSMKNRSSSNLLAGRLTPMKNSPKPSFIMNEGTTDMIASTDGNTENAIHDDNDHIYSTAAVAVEEEGDDEGEEQEESPRSFDEQELLEHLHDSELFTGLEEDGEISLENMVNFFLQTTNAGEYGESSGDTQQHPSLVVSSAVSAMEALESSSREIIDMILKDCEDELTTKED